MVYLLHIQGPIKSTEIKVPEMLQIENVIRGLPELCTNLMLQ